MDVDPAQVYEDAKRGVSDQTELLRRLVSGSPADRAWASVIDSQLWAANPHWGVRPDLGALASLGHPEITWRATLELAKHALLEFDSVLLSEARERLDADALEADDPTALIWAVAVRGWESLALGQHVRGLDEAFADAKRRGAADLVVELGSLRALVAIESGDLEEGRRLARQASRMARTESLPQAEYLANVILARLRRLRGYPHLAGRILDALLALASPRWHAWIRWELALSGGRVQPEPNDLAAALIRARRSAIEGRREAFEIAAADVHTKAAGFQPIAREAHYFLVACDPEAESVPPALQPWARGEDARAPVGLYAPDAEGSLGYVTASPGEPGRRILPSGRGLAAGLLISSVKKRKQNRVETLASVLALAGPEGLSEDDAFRAVYGFEYVPELHRGTFDVALHRARATLSEVGRLERTGARVRLELKVPLIVPDPRCAEPVEARLLRALAGGITTAKAAAEAAGVSLRQAQAALQSLAEDGACVAEKEGRRMAYRVEDTTFAEPTRAR